MNEGGKGTTVSQWVSKCLAIRVENSYVSVQSTRYYLRLQRFLCLPILNLRMVHVKRDLKPVLNAKRKINCVVAVIMIG